MRKITYICLTRKFRFLSIYGMIANFGVVVYVPSDIIFLGKMEIFL